MLKNVAPIQIQKAATFNSDHKQKIYFQTKHLDITNNNHR